MVLANEAARKARGSATETKNSGASGCAPTPLVQQAHVRRQCGRSKSNAYCVCWYTLGSLGSAAPAATPEGHQLFTMMGRNRCCCAGVVLAVRSSLPQQLPLAPEFCRKYYCAATARLFHHPFAPEPLRRRYCRHCCCAAAAPEVAICRLCYCAAATGCCVTAWSRQSHSGSSAATARRRQRQTDNNLPVPSLRGALSVHAADGVANELLDLELQLATLDQLVSADPLPLRIRLQKGGRTGRTCQSKLRVGPVK